MKKTNSKNDIPLKLSDPENFMIILLYEYNEIDHISSILDDESKQKKDKNGDIIMDIELPATLFDKFTEKYPDYDFENILSSTINNILDYFLKTAKNN